MAALRAFQRAREIIGRILIVEDEHLVALDIQQNLTRQGHEVVVVNNGADAIATATSQQFDLVLMDIRLGGSTDGIDAAMAIRAVAEVPIIYLTAYSDDRTLERARLTEPYGYVLKPFQERELLATIEMALERYRGERQRWEQEMLQRFLAEAGARMAATLDYQAVARGAGGLLVPRYADWCVVHLRRSDEVTPELTLWQPEGSPSDQGTLPRLLDTVLRTAHTEIISDLPNEDALRDTLGTSHLEELRVLGARSVICVPVLSRDEVLGCFAMGTGRSRSRYGASDVLFADDFGRRLGVALDNAVLHRRTERAIRMRDDVLAIVSHDLRTPLGTILLQAELIATKKEPHHEAAIAAILRSAQRMNRLIGDLLDASAINAGKLELELATHSAASIAREVLDQFRPMADGREIHLLETIDEEARVSCDRDRIIQVLSNLVGNALKFTPRGGTVMVAVVRDAARVRFEVRDSGDGIRPEQLQQLFTRFWRAHARRDGAGLGLFIASGIITAHDARLEVESREGAGTRFHFNLPAAS